jgi:hypothetical protein
LYGRHDRNPEILSAISTSILAIVRAASLRAHRPSNDQPAFLRSW